MSHPDKYVVGPLGLGMAALGVVLAFGVLAILALNSHRFLPLRRSRTTFWLGMAVLVPLACAGLPIFTSQAVQHLAVIASDGWDTYADGLRVINKHGQLSDGRFLSVFWAAAMGGGAFVISLFCVIPATVWYLHFNPSRDPRRFLQLSGVVRLDGQPLPRARITFFQVVGPRHRGFITVLADAAGRYEVHALPPQGFRITATGGVAVPPEYSDPARTPLRYAWDRLGSVTQDLELRSRPGGHEPGQPS
jgi:hypothetical protein